MKKHTPEKSQKYHKFLVREEKEKIERRKKWKEKREFKDAVNGISEKLQLEDDIEIDMDGPKKSLQGAHIWLQWRKKSESKKKNQNKLNLWIWLIKFKNSIIYISYSHMIIFSYNTIS